MGAMALCADGVEGVWKNGSPFVWPLRFWRAWPARLQNSGLKAAAAAELTAQVSEGYRMILSGRCSPHSFLFGGANSGAHKFPKVLMGLFEAPQAYLVPFEALCGQAITP
jgi:hypothetical protein